MLLYILLISFVLPLSICSMFTPLTLGFFPKKVKKDVADFISLDYNNGLPSTSSDPYLYCCIDSVDCIGLRAEIQKIGFEAVLKKIKDASFISVLQVDTLTNTVTSELTSYTVTCHCTHGSETQELFDRFNGKNIKYHNKIDNKMLNQSGARRVGECTVAWPVILDDEQIMLSCKTKFHNKDSLLRILDTL